MGRLKEDKLVKIAYASLAVAIVSVFTTIIGYSNGSGSYKAFSLLDFFVNGDLLDSFVLYEYIGTVYWDLDSGAIRIFVIVGVVALICAIVGVSMVSKQKENKWSFILALAGLIGTMAPSILIIICVLFMKNSYMGKISCGIYPIVTPIAMAICIMATTQMHRRNREYEQRLKEAEGLIERGRDLT